MGNQLVIKMEKVDTETGKVIESTELKRHDLKCPTGPHDFGLNHREQIDLLKEIQEQIMAGETDFLK
jgi:hypothetical protein